MSARADILSTIRMRRTGSKPQPSRYKAPPIAGDQVERFAERATIEAAEVRILGSLGEVPDAVADILRARNMAASVHLPPDARIGALPWGTAIALEHTAPGPNDAAVALAPFAIAETGTLVYTSAPDTPASWHFRPGLEIAIVAAGNILPHLEDVLARVGKPLPSTINLVTGPSRTGDIEQTLELGAHGPKALVILVVKN